MSHRLQEALILKSVPLHHTAPKYRSLEPTYNFQDLVRLVLSFPSAIIQKIRKEIGTMSKQKRFSKLTIVAGILLTASATCFAQTESTSSQTESTESVAVAINKAAKFEIRESRTNTNSAVEATTNETRPAFSASLFIA